MDTLSQVKRQKEGRNVSKLLIDESPLLVLPSLAATIGLNEAIVLQQVHYWLQVKKSAGKDYIDGNYWVYNSFSEWNKQFPFWSINTIKRTFYSLEEKGLLISGNYNQRNFDKTKWYSIDYSALTHFDTLVDPFWVDRETHFGSTNTIDYITDINNNNVTNPLEEKNPEDSDKDNAFSKKKEKDIHASSCNYINNVNIYNSIQKQRELIKSRKKEQLSLTLPETILLSEQSIHAAMVQSVIGEDACFESWVKEVVRYFLESYGRNRGEMHPAITVSQAVKIIDKYVLVPKSLENEDIGVREYKLMIDQYFKTKFGQRSGKKVDYRIMHFMNDKIREHMYWKISNSDI